MADANPTLADDDGPEPADAELVAYLDGELDSSAARKVEARLATDPALRARASALKRSFDLLDFLPRPEPSPTFATRTLDRLPAAKSSPEAVPALTPSAPTTTPVPPATVGGTSFGSGVLAPTGGGGRGWAWAFGLVLAVGAAIAGGYLGTAAARSYLRPPAPTSHEPTADSLSLTDLRVVSNLPLYAAVDDLEYLDRLAAPEFFGDDAQPPDGPLPPHPAEAEKPAGKPLNELLRMFRSLPAERQEQIRQLDRQLHEQDADRQDRLTRVLEAYAAWFYRLPDAGRKEVLSVPTAEKRLAAVRDVRNAQWVAALPAERQKLLRSPLDASERAKLLAQWKDEETRRREVWQTARAHWDALVTGKPPWPFDDERMQREAVTFAKAAYRSDDPKRCRVTPPERDRLREALDHAEKRGDWVWLGPAVYALSRKYEMLPEPAAGDPVLTPEDVVKEFGPRNLLKGAGRKQVVAQAGKWPDFALAVADHAARESKQPLPASHRLPSRPADFKDEVRNPFLPELHKKATADEWKRLKGLEGKWPEYPRELVRLAKTHDLSVPGAMPPGRPSLWEKTYGGNFKLPLPRPKNG